MILSDIYEQGYANWKCPECKTNVVESIMENKDGTESYLSHSYYINKGDKFRIICKRCAYPVATITVDKSGKPQSENQHL